MFSRNSNIPPRRGILTASNQNRLVNSENENNAKQSVKDANTKTSSQTTRLKSATTTNTNVFQKRRSVLNDVSNAKSQQKKMRKPLPTRPRLQKLFEQKLSTRRK
ncbi:hypothetical protein K450DRAFT_239888 [Umbelopsis ramanniana AG]|uniref:Uncharacterized protein n=1 Tax=Umbelopsis ramanniana AG TaxID=1314678 RepID=A0AAD5EAL7_UMBRA|nr:uncharacterized protein K450DRAFT_239888 [Umbelopsis ramanniana AG]KAI8579954.1 hypothetical protein K450DRAFT_239888 [Umbelopsis ramanniana AG]